MFPVEGSASIQEQILKNALIDNIPKNITSIDILIYEGKTLKKQLFGCTKISFVGKDTTGNKKADINIQHSSGNFLISLKNTPFKSWQSADSLAGNDVDLIVDEVIRAGQAKNAVLVHKDYNFGLQYNKPFFRIVNKTSGTKKTLIVDLNKKSKEKVVFGNDILNNGAVIQIDQRNSNFVTFLNNSIIIECTKYIDNVRQLNSLDIVYKITNISGVRGSHRYPGIRVEAVPASEKGTNYIIGKYKNINIVI
jgi:hypothetical protein